MSSPGRARPGNHNNGAMLFHDARHPAAKFDDASVRRIRRRFAQGVPARAIAEALGCHYDTIRRIVGGISYGAVPMPTTQTVRKSQGWRVLMATSLAVRKMPEPIMPPASNRMESVSESLRTSLASPGNMRSARKIAA